MHLRAYESINKPLREDNADAEYKARSNGAIILEFPGKRQPKPEIIGPIDRQCSLDGVIISLGGRDATVPVRLQDESMIYNCNTTRDLAKQIAQFIFGQTVRCHGVGKWFRDEKNGWHMKEFKIESFTPLRDTDLLHDVIEIRSVQADWSGEDI